MRSIFVTHSQADKNYIEKNTPTEVLTFFRKSVKRMASGEKKRTILPNTWEEYDPLNNIEERLEKVSQSPLIAAADEIASQDD